MIRESEMRIKGQTDEELQESIAKVKYHINVEQKHVGFDVSLCKEDMHLNADSTFGFKGLNGVQSKGFAITYDNGYYDVRFIKMDHLSPGWKYKHHKKQGDCDKLAEPVHDVFYPSIAEDICSRLLENCNINMESVLYDFKTVCISSNIKTCTVSENFVVEGTEEMILSKFNDSRAKINHDDYEVEIIDCVDINKIYDSLLKYFKKLRVKEEVAKEFIINQAAFDLMVGNQDRKRNATNFVFTRDVEGETTPINIDYGRCIQTLWTPTTEAQELEEEDMEEVADIVIGDALLRSSVFEPRIAKDIKVTVDFLFEKGYKPVEIDIDKMNKTLEEGLLKRVEGTNAKYFAKHKIILLNKMLNNKEIKRLWINKSN